MEIELPEFPFYKKLILKYLVAILFIFVASQVNALTYAEQEKKSEIIRSIIYHAVMNDIDPRLPLHIAKMESSFNPKAIGDMNIKCKRTGKPVRAKGLFQVTDCYWPQITDEQAFDPIWVTKWAMPLIASSTTCRKEWTTCRTLPPNLFVGLSKWRSGG